MITSRQLAERWGCSIEKIELDRYSGRGPNFVKVGRLVRYRMSDVVAYENANRVSTQVR